MINRKRARKTEEAGDVNVTPLLDIVFIMLIFFIVTATFVREKGIDAKTPDDSQDKAEKTPPSMILSVLENGLVRVGARTIDPYSVKNTVQEFLAREPDGVVLVSAAPDSSSGTTVIVMDQARQAGATGKLSLTLQAEVEG